MTRRPNQFSMIIQSMLIIASVSFSEVECDRPGNFFLKELCFERRRWCQHDLYQRWHSMTMPPYSHHWTLYYVKFHGKRPMVMSQTAANCQVRLCFRIVHTSKDSKNTWWYGRLCLEAILMMLIANVRFALLTIFISPIWMVTLYIRGVQCSLNMLKTIRVSSYFTTVSGEIVVLQPRQVGFPAACYYQSIWTLKSPTYHPS